MKVRDVIKLIEADGWCLVATRNVTMTLRQLKVGI